MVLDQEVCMLNNLIIIIFLLILFFELIKSFIGIIIGIVKLNKYIAYKHFYLLNGKIKGFFKFLYTE